MSDTSYAYAVARIRSKELSLMSEQDIAQLMACRSYQECLDLLAGKGWDVSLQNAEEMLASERDKTWHLIAELVEDLSVFNVFLIPNDYHNLKAAIKQISAEVVTPQIFIEQGTVPHERIIQAVKENDFSLLPEQMRPAAKEAYEMMLHTNDGQLSDIIVDKATLEAMVLAGKASKNELIDKYAELMVASIDIKIAVRCQKMGKDQFFINRALAHCDSIDTGQLGTAAAQGINEIYNYLERTDYAAAITAIKKSTSAFEQWCDNLIIATIRPQKYNPFTIAPLVAYILAREYEIKSVRIILSGKLNNLSDESVQERVRATYV